MPSPIVTEELTLLDQVIESLHGVPRLAPMSEEEIVLELNRLREDIRNALEDDRYTLQEQYNRHLSLLDRLRMARNRSTIDPESPYFGHLRLKEGERRRDICLGKSTHIQDEVKIVDWRHAPVSKIYYCYQQGEPYRVELGGEMVDGEVLVRRTVTIKDMSLERVDAPEGVFTREPGQDESWLTRPDDKLRLAGGERTALRADQLGLGSRATFRQRADKHLPDIAGLIDAEQFGLITKPDSGLVVVRGVAGSGKTTVGLHRIAWLAYGDPEINSPQTLIVIFSKALKRYVSHVLPALGVDDVQVLTFHEWASLQRLSHFRRLPKVYRENTPPQVVRLKLHPAMLEAINRHVATVEGRPSARQALDDWASVLSSHEIIDEVFSEHAPGAFERDELREISAWCRGQINDLQDWADGDRKNGAALDPEDDALLLRAYQKRVKPLKRKRGKPLRYRHLFIDEVQDFSPLEVQVLLDCLGPQGSVTLAGDTQQHVMQETGFTSWEGFFGALGMEGTPVDTLRVSYRSTQQIVDFGMAVLGDLVEDNEPPMTTRTGPEVELFQFTDHGACVDFLASALKSLVAAEPLAAIVLLAPDEEASGIYHEGLQNSGLTGLRLVRNQDFCFRPGIEVAELYDVKGLEFDYVVLLETSHACFPDDAMARRRLHVGVTRAVHQLWLTCVGTPSPIIEQALALA